MALSSKKLIIGIFALIAGTLCVIKLALGADRMMSTHNENNSKSNNNAATPAKSKADSKKDSLYKYQQSYLQYDSSSTTYTIAVISDKDKDSKVTKDGKSKWESNLMTGTLKRDPVTHKYSVSFSNKTITFKSKLNEAGRAMELSELLFFDNKLYSFDDRSGVVCEIDIYNKLAIPTHILMEGNGHTEKGQKNEWATVKDGEMYIGSIGKEWTNSKGEIINYNNQWIKKIDSEGRITPVDWRSVYENMRKATGTQLPGYLIHEAACFNQMDRKWYFMPRRESKEEYDDVKDEERGSNLVIVMDENMQKISSMRIGELNPRRGFSSFKFVPYRSDEFVALKTMEYKDSIKTYITVMNLKGEILLPETEFVDAKYEGIEFI